MTGDTPDPTGPPAIRDLVTRVGTWSGTSSDLLAVISPADPPKHWPSSPRQMSGAITRSAPVLRASDIDVDGRPAHPSCMEATA